MNGTIFFFHRLDFKMVDKIYFVLGRQFGIYFLVYPVIYFAWNFFTIGIGFPQYAIPDFWVGMVGYFLFNILKHNWE